MKKKKNDETGVLHKDNNRDINHQNNIIIRVIELRVSQIKEINIIGGEWGLASNTIHFIDLISFISGHDDVSLVACDISNPSESISKRPNFYETFGSIAGVCGDVEFNFSSGHGLGDSHLIQLKTDNTSITVDEISGEISFLKDGLTSMKKFEMPFQSNLSGGLAESILLHGRCGLTPFSVSAKLHLPFIRCINTTFKNKCFALDNLSLNEILPIIKNCNISICNDSSFSHLSSGLGVDTIVLMSDTPLLYGSYSSKMYPIIPDGENTVTHDTLGKDRINPDKIFEQLNYILN